MRKATGEMGNRRALLAALGLALHLSSGLAAAQRPDAPEIQVTLALAPQPLGDALNGLAEQSGFQIVVFSEDVADIPAPELRGLFTLPAALDELLAGSGLEYRFVNDRTIAVAKPERFSAQPEQPGTWPPLRRTPAVLTPQPLPPSIPLSTRTLRQAPVLVTALKREQELQDVPAPITSFSGASLQRSGTRSLRDLARLTPNFVGSTFNNTQPIFAIRGGSNTFSAIATSKPIAIYVDEIYLPRFSSAEFDLFDMERVEVLRGPQGTFFGRNVAAGAILLTTQAPSLDTFETMFSAEVGNLEAYALQGLVNGPLSDALAGKLTVTRAERAGYGHDILAMHEQDDLDRSAVRGALLWQPNGRFEAQLSADYARDRNGGRTLSAIDFGDTDRRTSQLGSNQAFERDIYGGSLRLRYRPGGGEWVSITGARFSESDELFGYTGLSFALLDTGFQQVDQYLETPSTFSQELRYLSPEAERLSYVAGVYLLREESERIVERRRLAAQTGRVIENVRLDQAVETDAYAVYADATLSLTDQVDLTMGLRYSAETRSASLDFTDRLAPEASFAAHGLDRRFDALTPRLALVYRPGEDITLYASVTRGFTAGGFNTEADTLAEFQVPFGPETITSYELGGKLRLGEGRGYANLSAFHQDYEDKQEFVLVPETGFGAIVNAAEATLDGIELEAGWAFSEALSASLTYGYLDARYDAFRIGDTTGNTGNRLGSAPRHQFSASLNGEYPIFHGAALAYGRADYAYTGSYFTGATNDSDLHIDSYGLIGGTVGVRSRDEGIAIELFGSNLADTDYVLIPSNFGVRSEYLGAPRLYGLRLVIRR